MNPWLLGQVAVHANTGLAVKAYGVSDKAVLRTAKLHLLWLAELRSAR